MKNKKVLYVNGCSHSCGCEISYVGSCREPADLEKSWGGYIARHYGLEHVNDAVPGQSNYAIYSNTIHSVLNLLETYRPEEIMVVIGWTSIDRTEVIYNNKLYRFVPAMDNLPYFKELPKAIQEAFRNFILMTDYENNSNNEFSLIYYNMVNFLKLHNIDYCFFNAIQSINVPQVNLLHMVDNSRPTYKIFEQIANDRKYISPFDNSMPYYQHLKPKFDCFAEGRNHHFLEDAQQYWAKFLIDHLEDKSIYENN